MNITSMNGQELYKTLFGKEVATKIKIAVSDECKQKVANGGRVDRLEIIDSFKADPCMSNISSLFQTGNSLYAYSYRINAFKTDDDFARHFGAIGQRLDTAFAEGKFTEEEYKELNASLTEYIREMKTKNDTRRAELEVFNSGHKFETNKTTGNPEEDKKIMEKFFEEKQKAVNSVLNRKGFTVGFDKIMEMINQYRNGTANIVGAIIVK